MCNDINHQKDFQEIRDVLADIKANSKYTSKTVDDINLKMSPLIKDVTNLQMRVHDNEQEISTMKLQRKEMNNRMWGLLSAVAVSIIMHANRLCI